MGADRVVVHYGGQLPTCYQYGGYDHIRAHCMTELCSKCRVRGHRTATCRQLPTCTLCRKVGHTYLYCPESETNRSDLEAFEHDKARRRHAESQGEAAGNQACLGRVLPGQLVGGRSQGGQAEG